MNPRNAAPYVRALSHIASRFSDKVPHGDDPATTAVRNATIGMQAEADAASAAFEASGG